MNILMSTHKLILGDMQRFDHIQLLRFCYVFYLNLSSLLLLISALYYCRV